MAAMETSSPSSGSQKVVTTPARRQPLRCVCVKPTSQTTIKVCVKTISQTNLEGTLETSWRLNWRLRFEHPGGYPLNHWRGRRPLPGLSTLFPMRPARPARCTYSATLAGGAKEYTCVTPRRSSPLAALAVATSRDASPRLNASKALRGS
eukprot:1114507-Prorocentrum_minimum.AAC.1